MGLCIKTTLKKAIHMGIMTALIFT